jgi:O-antigen ligase
MTFQALQKWYLWGLKALLYVVPFLPLYISNIMLFPYITGRNFAFRILVELALILWIGLTALDKEYRPRFSKLSAAVLVFVIIVFLADLFGANFYRSFWSNYERMEGFLMIAHLAAFFFITSSVFKFREWKIFANLIVMGSVFVSIWAFFQKLGILRSIQGGDRVEGSIGNPAYLAGYLILTIGIALLLYIHSQKRWQRYFYGAIALFELLIIYFSATRGALLALLLGALIFPALYLFMGRKESNLPMKKIAWGILAFFFAVPFLFWAVKDTSFVRSSNTLSRLASISLTEQTTESRFLIWNIAWKGFKEHPVLGWGQENFNLVFNKYYDPKLWRQEPWFDRSHNIVMDWLSNAGILGLTAYLSLFGFAIHALYRLYRKKTITPLAFSVAITFFVMYFLQNLFVFDNFNTYFIFFAMLALVGWAERKELTQEGPAAKDAFSFSLSMVTAAGLIGIFMFYVINLRPIQEAYSLLKALQLARVNPNAEAVLPSFQKAMAYDTFGRRESFEQFAQYAYQAAQSANVPKKSQELLLREAIKRGEEIVSEAPDDIRYRYFLGLYGYYSLARFDVEYIAKTEQELLKIIELSPAKQPVYFSLVQFYISAGKVERAFEVADKALQLEPSNPDAQVFYVVAAIHAKKTDIADESFKKYLDLQNPDRLGTILGAYAAMKQYDTIEFWYKELMRRYPLDAHYPAQLATLYKFMGKKDLARKMAEKVLEIAPTGQFADETKIFLEDLNEEK